MNTKINTDKSKVSQRSNIKDQRLNQSSNPELKVRAFYLSVNIIKSLESLHSKPAIRVISDQLIRSITSVGANIVEAKSSSPKREFLSYFQIALKSSNESKYWLAMIRELIPEERIAINGFLEELGQISKIIGTSVITMKGKTKL